MTVYRSGAYDGVDTFGMQGNHAEYHFLIPRYIEAQDLDELSVWGRPMQEQGRRLELLCQPGDELEN